MSDRILPTNDLCFKKIFADISNLDILRGLINDFFGLNPVDIIIQNPYSIESYKKLLKEAEEKGESIILRQTLRDVTANLIFADFTAEMQVTKTDFFGERSMYYTFDKYCQNYGDELTLKIPQNLYSSLKPVYTLNILRYNAFENSDRAFRVFKIFDEEEQKEFEPLTIRVAYFEILKTKATNKNQEYWREFFISGETDDTAPDYIKRAADVIKLVNMSEEERAVAARVDKAIADYNAGIATAKREGLIEGEIKAKIEAVINIILDFGATLSKAINTAKLPENARPDLIRELQARGIEYQP
ncbi:hypothetical protein FACS1894188_01610 [Clostridia bacterium]|nr:hypothetical protein FACS1894188_01610 [Clostridia bacterium]